MEVTGESSVLYEEGSLWNGEMLAIPLHCFAMGHPQFCPQSSFLLHQEAQFRLLIDREFSTVTKSDTPEFKFQAHLP